MFISLIHNQSLPNFIVPPDRLVFQDQDVRDKSFKSHQVNFKKSQHFHPPPPPTILTTTTTTTTNY